MASAGDGGWLRRLWPGRGPEVEPGGTQLLPVDALLHALEESLCEAVVRPPLEDGAAAHAAAPELFAGPARAEVGTGPQGRVAVATGMALSGLRATAFLAGSELVGAHGALCAAAERLAPVVVHAANGASGHRGYHAVAGAGLFQVLASRGQQAADLCLVARWLAERALVPGLVATDGEAVEPLQPPDEAAVRAYLGRPGDSIPAPTEGQRLLFGAERPRLLAWFDPERPVATGGLAGTPDEARAVSSRRLFFWDHVAELARRGMEELAERTGRPLSFIDCHRLDDADVVLVAQGAVAEAARATAERVRATRGWKVGVVGVTWLRPFPREDLVRALGGRRAVAVVEATDEPLADDPPLMRELRAALEPGDGWLSARCSGAGPEPERLEALCELLRRRDRPRAVDLERAALQEVTGFPRRDALLQALANSYEVLRTPALPEPERSRREPEAERSAGLVGAIAELPPDLGTRLARAVPAAAGSVVRARAGRPAPGVWRTQVHAADRDFAHPGARAPVSSLLVWGERFGELGAALDGVRHGGAVLVASAGEPEVLWARLPAAWRRAVRERELGLFAVPAELDAALEVLAGTLTPGGTDLGGTDRVREVRWRELAAPDASERSLPRSVRRIEHVRAAHDSLPRFWGEVVQPRQGGARDGLADPMAAAGVVPAGASSLEPGPEAPLLPAFDPEACTGCGRCWSACPDGAIGVTALGPEALLTAASAGGEGRAADALRRAHKHLAGRLAAELSKDGAGALGAEPLQEAWGWLSGRMGISDAERPEYEAAFAATVATATRQQLAITQPFFRDAERQQKGSGELLVLAIDPHACTGCGVCVASCPDAALEPAERTPERVAELDARWSGWEALPDTTGATLARAAEHPDVDPLGALLLTRHGARAQIGGTGGEPGSGERLGARLVAAVVEQQAQRQSAGLLEKLEAARKTLEEKLRELLGEGLSEAGADKLAQALGRVSRGRAELSDLSGELRALGAPATFDRPGALHVARLAAELAERRRRLAEGEDGLGRARFGVVVAEGALADWAARFPHHPYYAPLALAPTAEGVELARGIARGLVAAHVATVRALRRSRVEADSRGDRGARLEEIARLDWEDLDAEERAGCPPLLLLGDDGALLGQGLEALARLLASELPVKVVLLDGGDRLGAAPEPSLVALAQRRAFVLAGSLAHPHHLARGLVDALGRPGPALVHLYAPSPLRHGFPTDAALERARGAVEARAHVLLRYDPDADGHLGLRASLEGNPAPDADWGELDFAEWAAGEARFSAHFEAAEPGTGVPLRDWLGLAESARRGKLPVVEREGAALAVGNRVARAAEARLDVWNALRELVGAGGALAERLRSEQEAALEAEHLAKLGQLRAEAEARVAEVRSASDREALARLTARLMSLAGYGPKAPSGGNGG